MRILVICLSCLLLVLSGAALAYESPEQWTPEIAQMLAQEGWERYTPKPLEPVVGYEVHFVELSTDTVESLSPQFSVHPRQSAEAGWEVSWDAALLDTLTFSGPNYELKLEGTSDQSHAHTQYSSWMVTVGNQPLYVSLSEANLTRQAEDNLFQIRLTPVQIDPENQRIQTQIALKFSSDLGAVSQVELTNWVSSESKVPMAVVAKTEHNSSKMQKRYFALCVSGFVVAPDQIPGYASIVSIGNLVGLQRVFTKEEAEPRVLTSQWGAGLVYDSGGLGGYLSGRYASESSVLTGQLRYGPSLDYNLTARWRVHEHLSLLVALENHMDQLLPVFRLGIGDEVWLTPSFRISADLYPVEIAANEANEPPVTREIKFEFGFAYRGEALSVSYQGTIYQEELSHCIKGTISLNDECGLELAYTFSEKEQHRIAFGLTFSIF
ncbi:MAG TPA: hypothetical protein GX739_07495 [Firmicutes bacterium]|nr:hypothetical protein [Bacillota bacterium]